MSDAKTLAFQQTMASPDLLMMLLLCNSELGLDGALQAKGTVLDDGENYGSDVYYSFDGVMQGGAILATAGLMALSDDNKLCPTPSSYYLTRTAWRTN